MATQLSDTEYQKPPTILLPGLAELALEREGLGSLAFQKGPGPFVSVPVPVRAWGRTRSFQSSRLRELEWRSHHQEALQPFVGQWVAIEEDRVVAHADRLVEVVDAARAQGIRVPYVFRVEGLADDIVHIGL